MSQTLVSFDPNLTVIERPPCLNCRGPMMFTDIASGPAGFDVRTFECVMCNYSEKVAVRINMMGWINSRELRPPN
jgi:hypothetical protein